MSGAQVHEQVQSYKENAVLHCCPGSRSVHPQSSSAGTLSPWSSVFLHTAQMLHCRKIRCFQFFFLRRLLRSSSAVWRKPNTGNPFLSYDWTYCCKWRACQKAGILQHCCWRQGCRCGELVTCFSRGQWGVWGKQSWIIIGEIASHILPFVAL